MPVSWVIIRTDDPADVRIPNRFGYRRMHVVFGIRIAVVETMMSGPPEWTFLQCAASEPSHHELERTAGFVASVSEIAVVAAGYAEHADEKKCPAHDPIDQMNTCEKDTDAADVQRKKRNRFHPIRHFRQPRG